MSEKLKEFVVIKAPVMECSLQVQWELEYAVAPYKEG